MLKIVNQTTYPIGYSVGKRIPTSQQIAMGVLEPNQIAAYRVDNDPKDNSDALNCGVTTYRGDPTKPNATYLETLIVPGNATIVFSTQIVTGLLQPGK